MDKKETGPDWFWIIAAIIFIAFLLNKGDEWYGREIKISYKQGYEEGYEIGRSEAFAEVIDDINGDCNVDDALVMIDALCIYFSSDSEIVDELYNIEQIINLATASRY